MGEKKTGIAAEAMATIWKEMEAKKVYIPSRGGKKITGGQFVIGELTGEKTWIVKQDAISIPPDFLTSLATPELKMVVKIMAELKRLNAIWHYDYRSVGGKEEKTIGSLREKQILLRTENLSIHIVNPTFIRRGAYDSVVAATTNLIEECDKITEKLYVHLTTPKIAGPNGFARLKAD